MLFILQQMLNEAFIAYTYIVFHQLFDEKNIVRGLKLKQENNCKQFSA